MAARDLCTVAEVKAYLGEASASVDAILQALVSAFSEWVRAYTERDLTTSAYAYAGDGWGGQSLYLPEAPVSAVTSVTVDGRAIPQRLSAGGSGWYRVGQVVHLEGYAFSRGRGNVEIAYQAGYAVVPEVVRQATVQVVALRHKERAHLGVTSQGMQGESISFLTSEVPEDVRTILDTYSARFKG